jgi:hypothetical protein
MRLIRRDPVISSTERAAGLAPRNILFMALPPKIPLRSVACGALRSPHPDRAIASIDAAAIPA